MAELDQGPEHLELVTELLLGRLAALAELRIPRRRFGIKEAYGTGGPPIGGSRARRTRQPAPLMGQESRSRRMASRAAASACACSSAVGGLGSGT